MLFGGVFQSSQRIGRSGDELAPEHRLDELSPPAWREDEVSVECDATRVRVERRDLNLFVVRHSKRQRDIERELAQRTHVEHVDGDSEHAGSKDETIARAHGGRGTCDQRGSGPLRQFARIREQVPDPLGRGEEDISRTDFHGSVSLAARDESGGAD